MSNYVIYLVTFYLSSLTVKIGENIRGISKTEYLFLNDLIEVDSVDSTQWPKKSIELGFTNNIDGLSFEYFRRRTVHVIG